MLSTKPTLTGARITLRPLQLSDLPEYIDMLNDTESLRLTGTQRTFTADDATHWLGSLPEREGRVDWAILRACDGMFMGEIVINDHDPLNRVANLRIGLMTLFTNKGYGREALRLAIEFAFEEMHLHRLELSVYDFNQRAFYVYSQLGFRQEGCRRDVLYMDGAYHNSIDMAMLDHEYHPRRG